MHRPLGITLLALLTAINGLATSALGIATLMGNQLIYTQVGYGPNRVPPASLLGPFADYASWALLFIGLSAGTVSYGLVTRRPWARLSILALLAVIGLLTIIALGWGAWHGQWGVVAAGVVKLALYLALGWYLRLPAVRKAFSAQ
jgi:hypothetical protein